MVKKLRIAIRSFADFEAALAAQLDAYRDQNPGTDFEVVSLELHDLEDAVLGARGLRNGSWDLAIFPTDWTGSAAESGALEWLDPWMQKKPIPDWPEGWLSSLRDPIRRGERLNCLPWHDGPECLIFRKDLFENEEEKKAYSDRYCRPLAPPITWTEFYQTAQFFTRPNGEMYGSLFAAYPDGHNTLYDLVLQVWSRGGEIYDVEGRPALDSPEVIQALDYYRAIVNDSSACYPGAIKIDSIHSGDIFQSGKVAMMVNWFGFAARCQGGGSALGAKLGLAPIPGGSPGQTASLSNYWVIGIGAGSQQKQAAYDLLRHIASAPMDKLTALHGAVGVRLSTWNDAEILGRIPLYGELERLSSRARTLPFCQDLPKLAEIVNQVITEALTTEAKSEDILQRAQSEALTRGLKLSNS